MSKIETAEEVVPDAEKISDQFFESDQLSNLSISDKLTERDVELLRNVEIEGKFEKKYSILNNLRKRITEFEILIYNSLIK